MLKGLVDETTLERNVEDNVNDAVCDVVCDAVEEAEGSTVLRSDCAAVAKAPS